MFKNKTKLTIAIVGIIIFIIPIVFLNYTLDSLYQYAKTSAQESMQETLLELAHKTQKDLDPVNYLQNEFQKIHKQLFPQLPNEIINLKLDKDFAESLYSEELFDKIASITIASFSPIAISVNNPDSEKHYDYLSPSITNQVLYFDNDISVFTKAKRFIETHYIVKIARALYANGSNTSQQKVFEKYDAIGDEYDVSKKLCYKYISRYSYYLYKINQSLFTDYFGKQLLFPVLKYTVSSQGIHGYYSVLIPQSSIEPEAIITQILNNNNNPYEKIELIANSKSNISGIEETEDGFYYILDLPTNLKIQIKTYSELNKIDKTNLLNNRLKLSVYYPDKLIKQRYLNKSVKILSVLIFILYILISIRFIKSSQGLNIKLTYKLVLILSVIIILPILGTLVLSLIPSQNISEILSNNVAEEIHSKINNLNLLNEENNYREISFLYELKRRISESSNLSFDLGSKWPILKDEDKDWFNLTSEIWYVSPEGVLCRVADTGEINQQDKESGTLQLKYTNNLGLITNPGEEYKQYEKASTLALAFLEKYITSEKEEKSAGQESVITSDALTFLALNKCAFILCKDANNKPYYLSHKRSDLNKEPYRYLNAYTNANPLWHNIKTRFGNIELIITLHNRDEDLKNQWPIKRDSSAEINNLLYKIIYSLKDNGQTRIKTNNNYDIISEWHYKNDDPFVVGGISNVSHNTIYDFYIFLIIPVLIIYTVLLLMVVTGFISIFIKEPMSIYKEAINKLEDNEYGTTINSFSSDEFNDITKAFNAMSEALRQKEQIKRYVSSRLIESVENNDIQTAGAGKTEKVTILSSDIRNFTGISENHSPSEIVEMLNSYFTLMQQAITEQGGIIDKYIGDAIQAVFYNDPKREHQIIRACKAALSMRKALEKLNIERTKSGLFTIENGIGIATDLAITGTIGTTNGRKDYSVNGNVIERAASIEAKTKATKTKILVEKSSLDGITDMLIGNQFDDATMELIDVKS